jgi:hypothetical protein
MHDSRKHDFCHGVAWRGVELFRPLLRDEEARDAYAELYEIARQEVESYQRAEAGQEDRLLREHGYDH